MDMVWAGSVGLERLKWFGNGNICRSADVSFYGIGVCRGPNTRKSGGQVELVHELHIV